MNRRMLLSSGRHLLASAGLLATFEGVRLQALTGIARSLSSAAAASPSEASDKLHVCVVGSGPAGFYTVDRVRSTVTTHGHKKCVSLLREAPGPPVSEAALLCTPVRHPNRCQPLQPNACSRLPRRPPFLPDAAAEALRRQGARVHPGEGDGDWGPTDTNRTTVRICMFVPKWQYRSGLQSAAAFARPARPSSLLPLHCLTLPPQAVPRAYPADATHAPGRSLPRPHPTGPAAHPLRPGALGCGARPPGHQGAPPVGPVWG